LRIYINLNDIAPLVKNDKRIGYVTPANKTWKHESDEFSVIVQTNSEGFRGPEFPDRSKATGLKRIVFHGDSFLDAREVDEDMRFARIIDKQFGEEVDVAIIGLSGINAVHELNHYRTIGKFFVPDVVVLSFYSLNDLIFTDNNTFDLSGSGFHARVSSIDTRADESWGAEIGRKIIIVQYLYDALRLTLSKFPKLHNNQKDVQMVGAEAGESKKSQDYDMVSKVFSPNIKAKFNELETEGVFDITMTVLRSFRDEVEANGSQFFVLLIPPPMAIHYDQFNKIQQNYIQYVEHEEWDFAAVTNKMHSMLTAEKFNVINALPNLVNEAQNGKRLYYRNNQHLTSEGHKVIAGTLYENLRFLTE